MENKQKLNVMDFLTPVIKSVLKEYTITLPTKSGKTVIPIIKDLDKPIASEKDLPAKETSAYKNGIIFAKALEYFLDKYSKYFTNEDKFKTGKEYLFKVKNKIFDEFDRDLFYEDYIKMSGLDRKDYWDYFIDGFFDEFDKALDDVGRALTGLNPDDRNNLKV